jgi:hypothetical protein
MLVGARRHDDVLLPSAGSPSAGRSQEGRFVQGIVRSADIRQPPQTCKVVARMISTNGTSRPVPVALAARVAAAERFAATIISTFEKCEETSVPLSKAQKTTLLEAALVEFDGFEAELSSLMRVAELLSELGRNGHPRLDQEAD